MNAPAKGTLSYARVGVGDPAPWFKSRSTSNENYVFDTAAGRYVVLGFYISAGDEGVQALLRRLDENRAMFDDDRLCFFGVSIDPDDERLGRARENLPGIRHFWDTDGKVSRAYGAVPREPTSGGMRTQRFFLVLDPSLRVMAKFPIGGKPEDLDPLLAFLKALPPVGRHAGFEVQAPILVLPNVFEPELCRTLIAAYEADGGNESGFMREVGGETVRVQDHRHKRRRDCTITEPALVRTLQGAILRRVAPEIAKIYSFTVTRMERYIVGCYAAEDNAHFRAHRDNTTKATAHRRFAVSINLNADFAGGEVSFPEYGPRSYKAPPGGAVIFPCALLHAVSRVTEGRRYAFLPFLYDDAAAAIREANSQFLEGGSQYRAAVSAPAA